jgi:hypothetical protein
MVDPLSVAIGAGAFVIVLLSYGYAYQYGKAQADTVDMSDITDYLTRQQAIESLQQDVDDADTQN